MPKIYVLIADSARARLFVAERSLGPLQELETLAYPEGRLRERQLVSDRPGRSFDSAGEGRHAMGRTVEPTEQAAIEFSHMLAERLDEARKDNRFDRLIIAAAPSFLGLLRKALRAETAKHVTQEIDKNLVRMDPVEIREHLPERL